MVDLLVTGLSLAGVVVSPGAFAVVVALLGVAIVVALLGVAVVVTSLGVTVVCIPLGVAVVVTPVFLSVLAIKRGLKLYKVTWFLKLGSFVDVTTSASTIIGGPKICVFYLKYGSI